MLAKPIHSLSIRHIIAHHLGDAAWTWHPDTLIQEANRTLGPVEESNLYRLMALQTIFNSDEPKTDWMAFEKVLHGLQGTAPLFRILQVPDLMQLFIFIDVVKELDPSFFTELSDEVESYIASVFAFEEVPWVPAILNENSEIQEKVTSASGIDPAPFAEDYDNGKREPASMLIAQAYNAVMADRSVRTKGI